MSDLSAENQTATVRSEAHGTMGALFAHSAQRTRLVVYTWCGIAILIAWGWLALMAAGLSQIAPDQSLGPGMQQVTSLLSFLQTDGELPLLVKQFALLCLPGTVGSVSVASFMATVLMWFAMSVAMMLPAASPMWVTYSEIAETAHEKGQKVVSLAVLASGYLVCWFGFSILAAGLQIVLARGGWLVGPSLPTLGLLSAVILVLAGLYQFSAFREACLKKCRRPFATLFSRWTTATSGVFRLGFQQGLECLGCCWALMMVMFSVGLMNLAWMAAMTLFALIEKSVESKVTSRVFGFILMAWGGAIATIALLNS
ncbi:MAG: DUF2182 domain-containing protein [Pseudomonadota bacterium]